MLKGRVRTLLTATKAGITFWPLALRFAAEQRLRSQLWSMGIRTPSLHPFGVAAVAKKKTWHNRSEPWKWPMVKVKVWGPASDMSVTSHGYFVQTEEGKWYRSTVVAVPKSPEGQVPGDELQAGAEGEQAGVEATTIGDEQDEPLWLAVDPGRAEHAAEVPQPHDPPRKRVNGKSAPANLYGQAPSADEPEGGEPVAALRLLQHKILDGLLQEEAGAMVWGDFQEEDVRRVKDIKKEVEVLEKLIQEGAEKEGIKLRSLTAKIEEEVLQTRIATLDEVRGDLAKWRPAFEKEVKSLTSGPVTRISGAEFERLKADGDMEFLPAKAVASVKPDKLKARIVACGNYASGDPSDELDISAGGIDSIAIRGVIHAAAKRGYKAGTVDVKCAFLQAPRRGRCKVTVVEPPHILRQMNLVDKDEKWLVNCALYGFQESPADWGAFRGQTLRKLTWVDEGVKCWVEETAERHLWRVKASEETVGFLAIYVDDILAVAEPNRLKGIFSALEGAWECSKPEMIEDGMVRFCGYEISEREQGGFQLAQTGYLKDVLRRRGVTENAEVPLPKIEEGADEPPEAVRQHLREAQQLVGEVMWLSGRTRPDVAYATGVLSRLLHKRPKYVCALGVQLMKYLHRTWDVKLEYLPGKEGDEGRGLEIHADSSFAPPHEGYRSVQGIMISCQKSPLQWESTRQGFITQSTAEAELLGYLEGFQAGESVAALLSCLEMPEKRILRGDNKAALAQCLNESGTWRTRHLRLRAAKLREVLADHTSGWTAEHLKGTELVADGLTKALQGQAFTKFRGMLRMTPCASDQKVKVSKVLEKSVMSRATEIQGRPYVAVVAALAVGGLALMACGNHRLGGLLAAAAVAVHGRGPGKDERLQVNEVPKVRMLRRLGGSYQHEETADVLAPEVSELQELQMPVTPEGRREEDAESRPDLADMQGPTSSPSTTSADFSVVLGDEERRSTEGPWRNPEYLRPPTGADRWGMDHWEEGWILRVHGRKRQRPFQPTVRSLPCAGRQLGPRRATVVFTRWGRENIRETIYDDWREPRPWQRENWVGYTFIERVIDTTEMPRAA